MAVAQFRREYRTVRRAEGWGSHDGAYYRALPFRDLTGRFTDIWRIRAASYLTFVRDVLAPLEQVPRPLRILDLGAGSGWLAYRLAARGHQVLAIDLLEDELDGLGAARRHFSATVEVASAEFDHLPLPAAHADVVVFNAAFHYSTDYVRTLAEALRVLRPHGTLVILDTPMYVDPSSGARMVQERERRFRTTYGFASDALPSEHFLTPARLDQLAHALSLTWTLHRPPLHWQTRLERTLGGLRARREPATFPVIVGTRA
jgi:SAM-dependent methyltransferase